jgi:hypothetical protein
VVVDFKVWQTEGTILKEHTDLRTLLDHEDFTPSIKKIIETMRDGEEA